MSPYGGPFSKYRRLARKGIWRQAFLRAYGPNGTPLGDVTPRVKREIMRAVARGCVVTSTTGGTHAPGSYHYQKVWYLPKGGGPRRLGGRAADIGGGFVAMIRYYLDCKRRERKNGVQFIELFGPGNWFVKWGQFLVGQFPGHGDHVHVVPDEIY